MVYEKPIWWEIFFGGQTYQIFVSSYLMFTRMHERFLALSSYSSFRNFSISFSSSSGLHQSHYLDRCNPTRNYSLAICILMTSVVCIYYVTWQDHLLDPKVLGSQHVSTPYTTFPVSSHNNQTHIKDHECFFFTLLHVSWVIRSMGTNFSGYGSSSKTISHISRVLYLYALTFNNVSFLSMAWINIFLSARDNSEAVFSKKPMIFYTYFATLTKYWYMYRRINRLWVTIAGTWNYFNSFYLDYDPLPAHIVAV